MMKKTFAAALVAVTAQPALAAKFDPPDLNFEYQLHRQYLKNTGQGPHVSAKGLNVKYELQKGETLKTLSEMLYGDGQYWPRVWAKASGVANPHLVRPGHQLQFLLGSEDELPAFRFSEGEDDLALTEAAPNVIPTQGPGGNPIVEIPPPEVPPKPILRVPGSFPEWQSVFKKKPDKFVDDRGISIQRKKNPDKIYLRGWVQEQSVGKEAIGRYLENDNEAGLPIVNQYVYVKMNRGQGTTGMKALVVADAGQIRRLNKQWKPDERPYVTQVTAEIELREPVPAKFKGGDKEKYEAFRALVTKATGLSGENYYVIPGTIETITLAKEGSPGSVESQVIGSEKHSASAVYGPGDLVFLNKGSSDGVEIGQLYDVFADRSIRRSEAVVPYSPSSTATIKVVKVNGKVATAVLLSSFGSVQQGDVARAPTSRRDDGEELDNVDMKGGPSAADDDLAPESAKNGAGEDDLESEIGDHEF